MKAGAEVVQMDSQLSESKRYSIQSKQLEELSLSSNSRHLLLC